MLGRIRFVAFDVDAQGGTGSSRAGESIDDAGAILEQDAQTLPGRAGTIDGVLIGEVIGAADDGTDFQFSMDANGNPSHLQLDAFIEAYSSVPKGTFLVGAAKIRSKAGGSEFTFRAKEVEENWPQEFSGSTALDAEGNPTEDQQDTTKLMLRMQGVKSV